MDFTQAALIHISAPWWGPDRHHGSGRRRTPVTRPSRRIRRQAALRSSAAAATDVALMTGRDPASVPDAGRHLDRVRVPAGRILVREGELPKAAMVLLRGSVVVESGGSVVDRLGPLDRLGDRQLLSGEPMPSTAAAAEEVEVLVMWGPAFLASQRPETAPARAASVVPRARLEPAPVPVIV
jgi:CRP-like cAMP-binding protein